MKKYFGSSVEKLTRRQMVGGVAISGLAVLLAACGGGGGGDSSSDYGIDLDAAYERINECMTYEEVLNAVGAKPNTHDAVNTLIWDYGDFRLYVTTSDIASPGQKYYVVQDKELLRGIRRIKKYDFDIHCKRG